MPAAELQALNTAAPAAHLGGPPKQATPGDGMDPGQMQRGGSTSPLVLYFLPCAKFKQGPHHLQTEGPRGGRALRVASEDSMSMTVPRATDQRDSKLL